MCTPCVGLCTHAQECRFCHAARPCPGVTKAALVSLPPEQQKQHWCASAPALRARACARALACSCVGARVRACVRTGSRSSRICGERSTSSMICSESHSFTVCVCVSVCAHICVALRCVHILMSACLRACMLLYLPSHLSYMPHMPRCMSYVAMNLWVCMSLNMSLCLHSRLSRPC